MILRRNRLAAGIASACLLAAGCSSSSSTSTTSSGSSAALGTINLAAVLAKTGTYGAYGTGDALGMQARVSLLNQDGGVLGTHVNLTVVDDGSDAGKSAIAAQQLVAKDSRPTMLMAGATSVEAAAILPVTTRAHIVTMANLGTVSLSDPATYPYNFTTVTDATLRVQSVVKAFNQLQVDKLGIISSNDTGATAITDAASSGLPKEGFDVVSSQSVPLTTKDMTSQLAHIRQSGAAAIYAYFTSPSLYVTLMNNIETLGWKDVQIVASESALTKAVMTAIPPAVASQFLVLGPAALGRHGSKPQPAVERFVSELKRIGGNTDYLYSSLLASDTVVLTAWAIGHAHSTDPTKVLDALNSLHDTQLPDSVRASLLAMPPPKWSPTNHGLAGADIASVWTLLEPGEPVDGTYRLH